MVNGQVRVFVIPCDANVFNLPNPKIGQGTSDGKLQKKLSAEFVWQVQCCNACDLWMIRKDHALVDENYHLSRVSCKPSDGRESHAQEEEKAAQEAKEAEEAAVGPSDTA